MSLNSEGNEFQSLAAEYLNVDCPMADLTVGSQAMFYFSSFSGEH